jgi:hypothetical protein
VLLDKLLLQELVLLLLLLMELQGAQTKGVCLLGLVAARSSFFLSFFPPCCFLLCGR